LRLSYHPEAQTEVVEAARFYESQVPGLGAEFLEEFEQAVALIMEAPDRWLFVEHDVRRFLMRRFPYGILYRVVGDEVRILVVKHHSRHPDYWKERLTR
jgi:plasmid stabilization system protein ParE